MGSPARIPRQINGGRSRSCPDIVYARGVPVDPSLDIDAFNMKDCSLILIEVSFCRDLGCNQKYTKKTETYLPLLTALRKYW
jgi:hypothetical protein